MPDEPSIQENVMADDHDWYHLSVGAVAEKLSVDTERGLDDDAVSGSRDLHGVNELTEGKSIGLLTRFFVQFKNPLILILLVAGFATLLLGEYVDSTVIFIAMLVSVIAGTFQEQRASQAFAKLNETQSSEATVIRGGGKRVIPATEVVVGDVVVLDTGMNVPADTRIIQKDNLKMNEAALTGEWMTVSKETEKIQEDAVVSDRKNMAWKGTLVASGEGRGIVVAVGDATELGKIAQGLTDEINHDTPIQLHMKQLARFISMAALIIVALIFVLGILRSQGLLEMLLVAIAVAVSVVPEGLPAAVTVVLAIGMEKILEKGGLVKNLRAAETLGSTTVIMTDKTGTLTQAKMELADVLSFDRFDSDEASDTKEFSELQRYVLEAAMTSSDAFVEDTEDGPVVRGRAIEKAIVQRGMDADLDKAAIDKRRLDFMTFSSENRYAASLSQSETGNEADHNEFFFSGAPEFILDHSAQIRTTDGLKKIDDDLRRQIVDLQAAKSSEGKRLIAVAYKANQDDEIDRADEGRASDEQISDLIFLGILTFADPIREDVAESIAQAQSASVHVLMVTGDNQETARYIAKQAGIANDDMKALNGADLTDMTDAEILEAVKTHSVFARVLPDQKLRLAKLLRDRREVVAMTGDGVNDAPALRAADIGVSVGSGTEVAKEASDLVLLDDSFSIIVAAIEEGRRIMDNLKKILAQLLSTSFSEIFLIGGALALALPLPILPPQILWINMVEGALLTFVFVFEPASPDIMKRDPKEGRVRNLFSTSLKSLILLSSIITGLVAFGMYLALTAANLPMIEIRTMMFLLLTIDALLFTLSLKNFYQPIYRINFLNNKVLFASLGLAITAMFSAIYIPALQTLLSLTILPLWYWLVLAGIGIFYLAVIEAGKYFFFQHRQDKEEPEK